MRVRMAKKINPAQSILQPDDLATSREHTRSGFITMALEKNYMAIPYIEEAKTLKSLASRVKAPIELIGINDLRVGLLTASGLSDKSLVYLAEADRSIAIKGLIEKFLEPAGDNFIDELIYRYLLTKGDALGGKSRNLAGTLGERKFLRSLISAFSLAGVDYQWKSTESNIWMEKPVDDTDIEKRVKGFSWKKDYENRLLLLNMNIPLVNKNVDLSILQGTVDELKAGKKSIIHQHSRFLALGELKGGIDPAGADEHWKTANSALNRIKNSFAKKKLNPSTFFIGAAIESTMAIEIFKQLQSGVLHNAANLTNDDQLTNVCNWIVNL